MNSEDGRIMYHHVDNVFDTFSVFYLKSDIKLEGTGKSTDAFTLIKN